MLLRPYRPKVKGCHECSQRRLNCDRNVPECKKCIKKGIACSGLGVRHRFSNGVASRGHCVGKDMETAYSWMKKTKPPVIRSKGPTRSASNGVENNYDNGQGPTTTSPNFNPLPPFQSIHTINEHTVSLVGFAGPATPVIQPLAASTIVWGSPCESDGLSFLDIWSQKEVQRSSPYEDETFTPNGALVFPSPLPDHVPAWKRRLMLHFSSNIACEMIAVDGPHNGWRYLVLPVADRDELVMDAVLAVSLFHRPNVLQDIPLSDKPSRDFYARAIRGLQSRSQLHNCDQHSVIVTILLLLTAVMVNGSSDFPILFGMLQSAIEAMGGDATLGSGEMAEFLIRQVRKFKVYAAPLLTEHNGIDILSSEDEVGKMFECLYHCLENNPQYSRSLGLVTDLVQQACGIYLNQVSLDAKAQLTPQIRARRVKESIRRVQRYIDTFEEFPDNAPGKQVLVWATFMAALDCRLLEHKAWFLDFLLKHYTRNGFQNTNLGVEALRKVWLKKPEERWSILVPDLKVFIM